MGFGQSRFSDFLSRARAGTGANRPLPWSFGQANQGAGTPQPGASPQGNPYAAAFGKQAPTIEESMGLPAFHAQRQPQGPYNLQAHEGAWGVSGGDQWKDPSWNVNLGSGAMPDMERMSKYGSGVMGYARQAYDKANQFTQTPQMQQASQAALSGLLGGQLSPEVLRQLQGGSYLGFRV